jgi:SAM-dependent methyltransferase
MSDLFDCNRRRWNEVTSIHVKSAFYNVEGFKDGESSLKSVELSQLGDIRGKSLLHLQCHFGLDSLSLAQLGANVTGVDFSDEAIAVARHLNEELGLNANFFCSDVYKIPECIHETFDIVFTSYGVLCWLSDLPKWAEVISSRLKSGGFFFIAEEHPILSVLDGDQSGNLVAMYPYFNKEPVECLSDHSYADSSVEVNNKKTYQWDHSLSDVVNALLSAGLQIESLHEYPYCEYEKFPGLMFKDNDGWWKLKDKPLLPLLFSIKARKLRKEIAVPLA